MPRADDGGEPDPGWIGASTREKRTPLLSPPETAAADAEVEEEGLALLGGRVSFAPEPEISSDPPGKRRVRRLVFKGGGCTKALQCSCRCTPAVSALVILFTFVLFGGSSFRFFRFFRVIFVCFACFSPLSFAHLLDLISAHRRP